ncbi:MAG: glutamine synthetase [bacterium]|nr:glutamine synthetase [bacterium]
MNRKTDSSVDRSAVEPDGGFVRGHSPLERALGKKRNLWTEHDLARAYNELDLRQIALMHVGGDGTLKTLDFVPQNHDHFLRIVRFGERADGSSLFPGSGISAGASDIVLRPRIETAFVDPFSTEGTLALLCSHVTRAGEALPQSADTILRKAYKLLSDGAGFELHALGEVEYFVGHRLGESSDERLEDRGYHAAAPFVFGQDLRRRALAALAEIGVPIKYGHSEVGFAAARGENELTWEQHEIELALQPLPEAADSVLLTQWVLRNLAREFEMRISFDPVVRRGHAGSGMHFHLAPMKKGAYQRVLVTGGGIGKEAELLIAGLLHHGCSLMAFGNRKSSSFVRLFQGKESPGSVTWGQFNRKALVRLPVTTTDESGNAVSPETVEFRLPDGSTFPHLLLAGIAQAARAGLAIKNRAEFLRDMRTDAMIPAAGQTIPKGSDAVAELLEAERLVYQADGVFPATLIDAELTRLRTDAQNERLQAL